MIHVKAKTYQRQDAATLKLVLGFLFSPLVILAAFASAVAF